MAYFGPGDDEKIKQTPTPDEWAQAMSDKELLERMIGWADAELPHAVACEVARRFAMLTAKVVAGP